MRSGVGVASLVWLLMLGRLGRDEYEAVYEGEATSGDGQSGAERMHLTIGTASAPLRHFDLEIAPDGSRLVIEGHSFRIELEAAGSSDVVQFESKSVSGRSLGATYFSMLFRRAMSVTVRPLQVGFRADVGFGYGLRRDRPPAVRIIGDMVPQTTPVSS